MFRQQARCLRSASGSQRCGPSMNRQQSRRPPTAARACASSEVIVMPCEGSIVQEQIQAPSATTACLSRSSSPSRVSGSRRAECSVQRRNRKVIEEALSLSRDPQPRERSGASSPSCWRARSAPPKRKPTYRTVGRFPRGTHDCQRLEPTDQSDIVLMPGCANGIDADNRVYRVDLKKVWCARSFSSPETVRPDRK